jgi:mono/diheme cytochrome c family protein
MRRSFSFQNIFNRSRLAASVVIPVVIFYFCSMKLHAQQPQKWIAPKEAEAIKNPLAGKASATAKGKTEFVKTCLPCHGAKGKGDGPAGISLKPRPQDLMSEAVQSQSDGAIFWKISEGRAPMASYKSTFKAEQIWQLVNYLRQLKTEAK